MDLEKWEDFGFWWWFIEVLREWVFNIYIIGEFKKFVVMCLDSKEINLGRLIFGEDFVIG